MSLHTLANHLQSAGRGQDSVLVHMTPGEVNGLQSLAMSQGGSLTINPQTGLPEAGILSSLLPIVAGAFLGPAGLGLTAMQTGLAVGALGTAATGSLGKGLMMGFGAYGGAGLGEGLMNAGASSLGGAGAKAGAAGADVIDDVASAKLGSATTGAAGNSSYTGAKVAADTTGNAVTNTGGLQAYQPASPFSSTANLTSATPTMPGVTGVNAGSFNPTAYGGTVPVAPPVATGPNLNLSGTSAGTRNIGYDMYGGFTQAPPPVGPLSTAAPTRLGYGQTVPVTPPPVTPPAVTPPAVTPPPVTAPAAPVSNFDKVGAGIRDVTSSGTKAWEFVKAHPTPFIGVGVGALQEMQEQKAKDAAAAANAGKSPGMIRPYEMSVAQNQSAYAPNASTAERQFFAQPRYIAGTPYAAKEGGLMSLNKYAVGGAVEQMSAQNAVGDNKMYPQSQLQTPMYSNPMVQRPMPTNVISMGIDAPVDRYTGEQRFAEGGYAYDPKTQQYTQTASATPTPATNNPFGMLGLNPMMGFGGMLPEIYQKALRQQQAPQSTTTTETSGGISAPYVPQTQQMQQPQMQAINPIAPNINIPQQPNVNQQLGLESFYPMMEQQLAMKGSQLQSQNMADGGMAGGGYNLGGYSDGGRLLRGPGDGVSDSIPASIGNRQPARLADGEFVVPARIVSEIGNGSTEAGARKLYAMMDRVQKARGRTTGKNKVAVNTKAEKLLPA
jgi:hypothetical protein